MAIESFDGPYRFLSNFHYVTIQVNGWKFPTVENAYQAMKSKSPRVWGYIQYLTPQKAKRYGRTVPLRPDWEEVKVRFMEGLLREKFSKELHPKLYDALQATRPHELIKGNHWGDAFWGVCKGHGENQLEKLLMKIRDEVT